MRTCIISSYNDKFRELSEITFPVMQAYAKRWWHKYLMANSAAENPYWEKVRQVIFVLTKHGCDRAIWLDADQLITNPAVTFDQFTSGVHFSKDWGLDATEDSHFSACGFVACRDALPLFEWIESVREQYVNGPFPEQTPMRLAYAENRFPGLMHVHPRRVFNAVPIEVHPSAPEPWQPGDFAAHLTMLPVPERVALAKKYAL